MAIESRGHAARVDAHPTHLNTNYTMYYDLFAPFPITEAPVKKKGDKGKAKAAAAEAEAAPTDCWAGLTSTERAQVARTVALQGHCG